MKQVYQKPNMEWIDFNFMERIAASGSGCMPTFCNQGASGCTTGPVTGWNNVAP